MAGHSNRENTVFNVSKFGAKGDGKTLNTEIIQRTINKCSKNSKSAFDCKILISADKYGKIFLTGALYLRSNMTFEIDNGTILRGSSSFADYPLVNNVVAALLYGINNLTNVRIVGLGTIDGQGWQRSSSDTIDELGNYLAYYENSYFSTWNKTGILARSQMEAAINRSNGNMSNSYLVNAYASVRSSLITFYYATNIFIGYIRLINPAFHGIRFLLGKNVVCAYTKTETYNINNADGIQSQSINTIIFNNFINSGDDCVVFKAGQGQSVANFPPTQYGWVFNNYMREGHGVVVLGSETGSWIKDILAEDNVAFLTENGMRVKSTAQTGGGCKNYYFRDTAMREIGTKNIIEINGHLFNRSNVIYQSGSQCAFVLSMTYNLGSTNWIRAKTPSHFLDINVKSVTVDNGNTATGGPMISVTGYSGQDISLGYPETFSKNVTFEDIKIIRARPANISRLQDSLFKNILIQDWGNFNSPWILNNTKNLKFINVQPMPN
uniref:Polygalacturonase n=1 Tax=Meloidogyne incognita TaxID=6306 RepID=A0A914NGM8_MELIC